MTLHCVGFIPAAPLLVPDVVGGAIDRDADLRRVVRDVVRSVAAVQHTTGAGIIVVGAAPTTGDVEGTWDFRRLGVRRPDQAPVPLPTSLAIGAWFLDEATAAGPRTYLGVSREASPADCVETGKDLTGDVVLLVVADGSACHGDKAPGGNDPRAVDIDREIARAIGGADPEALLALDPATCRELLVGGRGPWQVAAAAAQGRSWRGDLLLDDRRYGVGYLAGLWMPDIA